jgi:membrane-associated protease RseP (regulator of RpoE activity)
VAIPHPDNVGIIPDVDRGNVVKTVTPKSPAAKAGLKPGDQLRSLNRVPIHSFGDALFALDRAPKKGEIDVTWERDGQARSTVNNNVARIKRMFRWGAQNELIPVTIYQALATVAGLRKGRRSAREPQPISP